MLIIKKLEGKYEKSLWMLVKLFLNLRVIELFHHVLNNKKSKQPLNVSLIFLTFKGNQVIVLCKKYEKTILSLIVRPIVFVDKGKIFISLFHSNKSRVTVFFHLFFLNYMEMVLAVFLILQIFFS